MKYFVWFIVLLVILSIGIFVSKKQSILKWDNSTMLSQENISIEKKATEKKTVSLLFGGDMQFDRYIRTVMKKRGEDFILSSLHDTFSSVDMVVANLEGPITDNASISETSAMGEAKNYMFTFPTSTANFLKREHIDIVNIGNNHILNFKSDGAEQTKKYLAESAVDYFGSPLEGDVRTLIKNINGTTIAFVNYNQFVFGAKEKVLSDITSVQGKADFVVLYTHWGKEYESVLPGVKDLAHEFIDVGVDIIIGSHPHVVQEKEIYKGKHIYYSLGNFIFDQYFRPDTQKGLLVRVIFDPSTHSITTEDISIALKNNGQTVLAPKQ
ncbi:MAG: CapA family protein [Candidatus Moraniibacteriota bacterium]